MSSELLDERLACLALSTLPGLGKARVLRLMQAAGSARAVFANGASVRHLLPAMAGKTLQHITSGEALRVAEQELLWAERQGIACLTWADEAFPQRLRECEDAPTALFFKGTANLNAAHVVSVVGTRNATAYGADVCNAFVQEFAALCPEALIVSGLAYGIDVLAHKAALQQGLPTVGVLAHGLDRIYPYAHRNVSTRMQACGGLLTEFFSGTEPERHNFVSRNRIVAGLADATIVVESGQKGGSLITATLSQDYNRECFAVPGRLSDQVSRGCNDLISQNKAVIFTSAADFVTHMGWQPAQHLQQPLLQQDLFTTLTPLQQMVVEVLKQQPEGVQINSIAVQTNLPVSQVSSTLFELEMQGYVRALAGGCYRWLKG